MKRIKNVLIVDDDEDDYFITSEYLHQIAEQAFEITWASTFQSAQELLRTKHFDICFFDYVLGVRTGLDLLNVAHELKLRTPIILLTGKINENVDQYAIRQGVADYLEKADLDAPKLQRSIRYALERTAFLQALQESEEKYRSIFEDSLDAVCLLDQYGRFMDANNAALSLLGWNTEDISEKKLSDSFHDEAANRVFLEKIRNGRNIIDYEVQLRSSDGEIHDCVLACTCLRAPERKDDFFFQCILRDITRRKKMERQILAAEKLAATGRFMRMLGHEIRNPLNNIDLATNQLSEENEDKELEYYIEIIGRNSKRINQLLTELLKSTANPGEVELLPIAVTDLLDQVLEMSADRMALKNLQLARAYDAAATYVVGADLSKLSIALLNIVINGIEVLEENKGVMTVELLDNESEIGILIRDNGPGIAREVQHQIFEPYFSRKNNGMGLGLASALSIVQLHRGRIELYSQPGEGATFTVWLPKVTPA